MASSDVVLIGDEKVIVSLKTEMYAITTNVFLNFFAQIVAVVSKILGCQMVGQLTITDKRVIIEKHQRMFWVFDSAAVYSTLMPTAIATVDYAFVGQVLCFCRKYMLTITTSSALAYAFVIKGGKNQASEIANTVLSTLLKNR